ncbi:hypothetical protein U1Q18_030500, partial [Sarracenia purpurea var. burkii]
QDSKIEILTGMNRMESGLVAHPILKSSRGPSQQRPRSLLWCNAWQLDDRDLCMSNLTCFIATGAGPGPPP